MHIQVHLYNAILNLRYISNQWKLAKIIMIQKLDKAPEVPSSLRPISLLSVMSKLFEKLYTRWLIKTVEDRNLIPDHQFGSRAKHSTVEQVHQVGALEEKKFCPLAFLDVSQAFDRVWIKRLRHKISQNFSAQHV